MGTGAPTLRRPATLTALVAFLLAVVPAAGAATSLHATTTASPREVFFGDPVTVVVTVRFDSARVDPASVSIDLPTAPFAQLAAPRFERAGSTASLVLRLACLSDRCLSGRPRRVVPIGPARVRYREAGRARAETVGGPQVLVASRVTSADLRRPQLRTRLGPPTATGGEDILGWGLVAGAGICLLAGLAAIGRRLRGRGQIPAAEPERLTAALAEVESLAEQADEARRTAIDRLATALDEAGLGRLAPRARTLAWSRRAPTAEPMRRLVRTVERFRRAA